MLITREVLAEGWLPAAAAGLIFALHPVHVEPVIWITGRVDTISSLGYLLGIYGLLRFRSSPAWHWLAMCWIGYGAGIFAKEAALTLPLMALLCELFFVPRNERLNVPRSVSPYLGWAVNAVAPVCRHDCSRVVDASTPSSGQGGGNLPSEFIAPAARLPSVSASRRR
jgi:hypothetical protein